MDDFDGPDFDGDGDFDAIDIAILEDEEGGKPKGNSGCCVIFLAIGSSLAGAMWGISYFIT